METTKIETIKAIEEIIRYFESDILDDYILDSGVGVMRKPKVKQGIAKEIVAETGVPSAFVTATVDLIYMTDELE